MADKVLYWLWLQEGLGSYFAVSKLIEKYGDAENFYRQGEVAFKNERLNKIICERLNKNKPEDFAERLDFCNKHKIHLLTPDSEYYPSQLLEIENYPLVLYVRGDYKIFNDSKMIAVIGSRTPCVYGEKASVKIVKGLTDNGYVIVSGGALGIDSVAHKTALDNGGKTVLVMGCGHGNSYLPENSDLRKAVSFNGALVSEYPPYSPVTAGSFPRRNRIISGLSRGVVIVEAADPSGTFSTANHALEQGRDIFVLPGDIESGNFAGSNRLITEGANPVFSAEDILLYYRDIASSKKHSETKNGAVFEKINVESEFSKTKVPKIRKKKSKQDKTDNENISVKEKSKQKIEKKEKISLEGISKNALIVYNIMSDGVVTLDEIKRESGLDISKVLVSLTELEMFSIAESDGPNTYRLK